MRSLLVLSAPVLIEQVLHIFVGLNDTYLANNVLSVDSGMTATDVAQVRDTNAGAAAAVSTISFILWFVGLVTGAIGTGATAIIARASGARHRSMANGVCGQAMSVGMLAGVALGAIMFWGCELVADLTGLRGAAHDFARSYVRLLAISMPFLTTMFVANSCLRGAGDTLTPAVTFIFVDLVNLVLSWGLTYGLFGFPRLGFTGIAVGTLIAYVAGGIIQFIVLLVGRGGIKLYLHRLSPHWHHLKRLLKIGLPSGLEGLLQWGASFAILVLVNRMDPTNISAAAHGNTIRIEGISYLSGFAVATAAATMVGQSLGMNNPRRAARVGYLAYALGGGIMVLMGMLYILMGERFARLMSDDPAVVQLTARCLFITGFCQFGFAAAMIFGGAMRGAGDTFKVMLINLTSVLGLRLVGAVLAVTVFKLRLEAVWVVLSCELCVRGSLMFARYRSGAWKRVQV